MKTLLVILLWASSAHAQPCGSADVSLRAEPAGMRKLVAAQLAVGLRAAGIGVCASDEGAPIARIEIVAAGEARPLLRVDDEVTHKRLERELDLTRVPVDGRPVAIALYVEELLQVSWAELALQTPVDESHPVVVPPEVEREVARALPSPRLRLAVGAMVIRYRRGLVQAGPSIGVGYHVLPWLELSLRFAYRLPERTQARTGHIDTQSLLGGVQLTPFLGLPAGMSLVFPQGLDVISATFLARANEDAIASSAVRAAVAVHHGVGVAVALSRDFSLRAVARLSWTALPAEASEDRRVVVGIAGVGGEGELTLDARF